MLQHGELIDGFNFYTKLVAVPALGIIFVVLGLFVGMLGRLMGLLGLFGSVRGLKTSDMGG